MTSKFLTARTHQFIHHAPQFRPIKRGARRKGIERTYSSKDGTSTLKIGLFYELDIADQDLLLCLLAILQPEERGNMIDHRSKNAVALVKDLNLDGAVKGMQMLGARTSTYELLIELGKGTGKAQYKWLTDSLERLSRVHFIYDTPSAHGSFNLLSWHADKGGDGKIREIKYVVNPYSAKAVLGDGGYFLCHRGERNELNTAEAKALHSVLSGLVMHGNKRSLSVDMLSDKVYARYDEEVNDSSIRFRRSAILRAAKEVDDLNYWTCAASGRGKDSFLVVSRKKAK